LEASITDLLHLYPALGDQVREAARVAAR